MPTPAEIRDAARATLALMDSDELPEDELSDTARIAIGREPMSRAQRHPRVIAAAHPVRCHPALGVRCKCGQGLGWVALVTISTGLFLVHSDKRQPKKALRRGGYTDLAPVGPGSHETFVLGPWDYQLKLGIGAVRATTTLGGLLGPGTPGVMFDCAQRVTYTCPSCHAEYPMRSDAFVRRFLQAVVDGDKELRLGMSASTRATDARSPTPEG